MNERLIHKLTPFILLTLGLLLITAAGFYLATNSTLPSDPVAVPVKTNYPAPELTLADVQGVSHSLADYRGQVVLVNLWATWCEPCKDEMPALQSFYDDYRERDFIVIAINDGESQADVLEFLEEFKLTFPVWLDPTYTATEEVFKTIGLPTSFVMDRSGMVRFYWVGGIDYETLESTVAPMILEEP
jgi:thiol-disulfide isomerase/thioredoxin